MEKINETDKIDLGRINFYDFDKSQIDVISFDQKKDQMDVFWEGNGQFGELNPDEIKISKNDLYGKIGNLYFELYSINKRIRGRDPQRRDYPNEYFEVLQSQKEVIQKNLKTFTEIAEKCWNLWYPLESIRQLTWEIRYGGLNCDTENEKVVKGYVDECVEKIKEIQKKIDKDFILDKKEYEYFYTDYQFLKERFNFS